MTATAAPTFPIGIAVREGAGSRTGRASPPRSGAARTSLFDGAPLTLTSAGSAQAAAMVGARWEVPLHILGRAHFSEGPDTVGPAFEKAGLSDRLR